MTRNDAPALAVLLLLPLTLGVASLRIPQEKEHSASSSSAAVIINASANSLAVATCPFATTKGYACPHPHPTMGSVDAHHTSNSNKTLVQFMGFDPVRDATLLPAFDPEPSHIQITEHIISRRLTSTNSYKSFSDWADATNVTSRTFFNETASLVVPVEQRHHQTQSIEQAGRRVHPLLQRAFDALPAEYDAKVYGLIIHYWGTFVAVNLTVGSVAQQASAVKTCIYAGVDVTEESRLSMNKALYPGQYKQVVNGAYLSHTRSESIHMAGGDPTLALPEQWEERVGTAKTAPAITTIHDTIPIYELVRNLTVKANLKRAVSEYLSLAVLSHNAEVAQCKAELTQPTTVTMLRFGVGPKYNPHGGHRASQVVAAGATMHAGTGMFEANCNRAADGSLTAALPPGSTEWGVNSTIVGNPCEPLWYGDTTTTTTTE